MTQSTIGFATATEWMSFGWVNASIVARPPPICEPNRDTLGKISGSHGSTAVVEDERTIGRIFLRMYAKATDVS